jgi:peroxiredoxin
MFKRMTADAPRPRGGLLIGLLCVAAVTGGCGGGDLPSISVGDKAPVFSLVDLRGDAVSLRDLNQRGVTLVNFWASWCAPCKAEVPILNQLQHKLSSAGVTVVGVSVEEPKAVVDAFVRKHHIEYPVLLDSDASVSRRYGLIGMPMNVIVDRKGVVSMRKYGVVDEEVTAALTAMGEGSVAAAPANRH